MVCILLLRVKEQPRKVVNLCTKVTARARKKIHLLYRCMIKIIDMSPVLLLVSETI